jgi:hypothetical protein
LPIESDVAGLFFSLLVSVIVFLLWIFLWAASTWLLMEIFPGPKLPFQELLVGAAISMAPLLLGFLVLLPYIGNPIFQILRIWVLLIFLVVIGTGSDITYLRALIFAGLGWLVIELVLRFPPLQFERLRNWGWRFATGTSISSDPEWWVRSGLLDNPNTPSDIIELLLDRPISGEREIIQSLSQPQISDELLLQLVGHPSLEVRYALARHPAATPDILGMLSTDGVKEIRRLAASHPKTDPDIIQRLVQAGSMPDLMGLSEPDEGMSPDEIRKLLQGGVWARQLAVRHPNSDAEILAHLLCDREPKIREWAAVHPNLNPAFKRDLIRAGSGTDFQGIMPPDPNLPAGTLEKISQLGSWGKWVVANNPYALSELLGFLANSKDWQVRLFVAKNPNTSQKTLVRLANDTVENIVGVARVRIAE